MAAARDLPPPAVREQRDACRRHARRRRSERGFPIPIAAAEQTVWRMRACWRREGETRQTLLMRFGRHPSDAWYVVWDSALACIVTVFPVTRGDGHQAGGHA